jgi:hypothetical protein
MQTGQLFFVASTLQAATMMAASAAVRAGLVRMPWILNSGSISAATLNQEEARG